MVTRFNKSLHLFLSRYKESNGGLLKLPDRTAYFKKQGLVPVTVNLHHLARHRFLFLSIQGTRDGPFTASALCTTPVIVLIVISDTFTHSVKDLGVSGPGPALL